MYYTSFVKYKELLEMSSDLSKYLPESLERSYPPEYVQSIKLEAEKDMQRYTENQAQISKGKYCY